MSHRTLLTLAGRLVLGYLMFRYFSPSARVEAAPSSQLVQELADQSDSRIDQTAVCTPLGMQDFLNQTKDLSEDDTELIYETCRDQFLQGNQISDEVKKIVDEWVGTDLSKAELNQVFLIYQLALLGPKPEKTSEKFESDCAHMVNQFETYRQTIEPLTSYIDVDLDAMLNDSDDEIDDQERDLLNYVQYAQFCAEITSRDEDLARRK